MTNLIAAEFAYAALSADDQTQVRIHTARVIEEMSARHEGGHLMNGYSERFTLESGHEVRIDGNALGVNLDVFETADAERPSLHIKLMDGLDLERDNAGAASRKAERDDWLNYGYQHAKLGIFI